MGRGVIVRGLGALALGAALWGAPAPAQEAWIQLEADRSLGAARTAAREYGARGAPVAGFRAAGGWFVVALGPYAPAEARALLDRLRAEGMAPPDAYVTDGDAYRRQFWPVGAALAAEADAAPEAAAEPTEPEPESEPAAAPSPDAAPETRAEALASERALGAEDKRALQVALAWSGHYEGAIDAQFGPATRRAMTAWQEARGVEPTGVLTTAQRAALLRDYDAVFDGLDMARVVDRPAGIAVEMPTAWVSLAGRETPLARYEGERGAQVILISREGDARALAGLYEGVLTLEVVPRGGERSLGEDAWEVEGRDDERVTRGFARLADGQVKGMLLVWPAEEEARLDRVWERMRASFEADPARALGRAHEAPAEAQSLDHLAGLAVRAPSLARSGVFVDGDGAVLTTAEMAACAAPMIEDAHAARVAWSDDRVALLRPERPLAPPRVAAFEAAPERIGARLALAGYPFGGALGRASVTWGSLEDVRGLGGEAALDRYRMPHEAGDVGGPVLSEDGAVTGLLVAPEGARVLPPGVAQGVDASVLARALEEAGVEARPASARATSPEALARAAAQMTTLVTCYD